MCALLKYVYDEFGIPQLINENEQLNCKSEYSSPNQEKFKLQLIMDKNSTLIDNRQFVKREKLLKKRATIYDYPETKAQQFLQNDTTNFKGNNLNKITKIWTNDKELKCYVNNKIKKFNEIRNINPQNLSNGTSNQQFDNCFIPTTNKQINNFNTGLDF